jgi:hypothetical protein
VVVFFELVDFFQQFLVFNIYGGNSRLYSIALLFSFSKRVLPTHLFLSVERLLKSFERSQELIAVQAKVHIYYFVLVFVHKIRCRIKISLATSFENLFRPFPVQGHYVLHRISELPIGQHDGEVGCK